MESYSLHHHRRRLLLLIVSENKLPHVVGLFVQYPEMKKTMGEFTLEIRAGEFTDSEIMVMLGENGTFPPSKSSFIKFLWWNNESGSVYLFVFNVCTSVCVSAGTGKTTFIRMLAGGLKSDGGGESHTSSPQHHQTPLTNVQILRVVEL